MRRRAPVQADPAASPALWAVGLVLICGAATSLVLNWPGQLSPDSVTQLRQGREGLYNAWHPPVMAWLLGLFDKLSPGTGGFIGFDAVLGFGGLFAFAALAARPRWIAVGVAAVLAASPLLLIYQGDVWKDVLFADASLAGFAALAWSAKLWASAPRRYALAALALTLLSLAALVRQNGLVAPLGGAAGYAALAWRAAPQDRWRLARAGGQGLLALAVSLAMVLAGNLALATRSDGDQAQAEQLEWLQMWDLTGAVHADPRLDLRGLQAEAPDAAGLARAAAKVWTPQRIDSLIVFPGADDALDEAGPAVDRQWRRLILTRPWLYARVRLAAFGQVLATPDLPACRPLFIGLDGAPVDLKALRLPPRDRMKDKSMRAYGLAFVGTPVLSHLTYAALALLLTGLAARDLGRPSAPGDRVAVIALLATAAVFAASFLIVGLACDYRYLYFLDLAAMAALLHRAAQA